MERYRHTETGWILIGIMSAAALVTLAAGAALEAGLHAGPGYLLPLLLAVVLANLYKLTVTVDEQAVKLSMGIGLVTKKFPLGEIRAAGTAGNSVLCGWGIHYTRDGWLFNVNSLRAVKLEMKNGRRYQIGTDEPEALLAALRDAGVAQMLDRQPCP